MYNFPKLPPAYYLTAYMTPHPNASTETELSTLHPP